jgi:hypothetical protein
MATKDDVRRVLDIIYGRARGNRRITLRSTMLQSLAATRCDCLEQILPRFLPVQCCAWDSFACVVKERNEVRFPNQRLNALVSYCK